MLTTKANAAGLGDGGVQRNDQLGGSIVCLNSPDQPQKQAGARVDPRLAWLARAAAKHLLVDAGKIGLVEAFNDLACGLIALVPERMTVDQLVELWERRDPYRGPRR